MQKATALLALLTVISLMAQAQNNNAFPIQTNIGQGIIEGNYDTGTGIQTYLGIPFAKPPVGPLRWKAPEAPDRWTGIREAKKFGPRPMQKQIWGDMTSRSDGVSEDCLYLNVWTPAKRNTKGLPVLVYFYGGGFAAGDASEPRYDGAKMAEKGIVVVTCNYRLNIFGFFAHPGLTAESPHKASGNYGLMDQAAALQWVHQNIAAFGGDPAKVTIAGESAGSSSVSYQMASPLSKNLIAGAIGESGAGMGAAPLSKGEQIGTEFASQFGYSTIEQLRALPARDIYEMWSEGNLFRFPVVIDGYFLTKSLPEIFSAGEQAQVPLLVGWNSAEMPAAAFMQGQSFTPEHYAARVKKEYPNDSETVLRLYPGQTELEVEVSATALAADRFIAFSTWRWFDLHRKHSTRPVYRYLYSKIRPPLVDQSLTAGLAGGTMKKESNTPPPPKPIGAPHAAEIEYCMGNLNLVKLFSWTPEDFQVSGTMLNYFANFIKTGNPNGDNQAEWPAAKPDDKEPPVMIIDVHSGAEKAKADGRYEWMDKAAKQ
jgi:para-nitrobenzyl esterase